MDKCLVCEGKIIRRCRCFMSETLCENGHEYWYSVEDKKWYSGTPKDKEKIEIK